MILLGTHVRFYPYRAQLPKEHPTANRYEVTRQEVNCGPTRTIYVETLAEAEYAFNVALKQGAIFAEVFDMELDSQVRVEYPRLVRV